MIPSIISEQLEQGLKDFLKTTFPISSPFFHGLMDNFLEKKENIFKGPYLSINLPFRKSSLKKDFFKDISLKFPPFIHQELAFKRLSSENPKSTIIATGTGSGKTESFLYPIINYCYQKKGQKGIKAILIYPMNALATDQAKRLALIINSNENLKGKITAGLFVGQSEKDPHQTMGEENIITNKDILRDNPPDILLTNYKMLDYLLIRPKDFKLWKHNNPDTLRYLVVDELHTFDGAQGTDLSCLIRRLKARLETPENYLCSIGTSATIGGEDAKEALRKYASQLFNNEFDNDSIITENRINLGEFLDGSFITYIDVIPPEKEALLNYQNYNSYEDYIKNQFKLWFIEEIIENDENWKINLSDKLKENLFFRNLLTTLQDKNKSGKLRVRSYKEIISDLRRATRLTSEVSDDFFINLIISITSLISVARVKIKTEDDREIILPFLNIRFQLWTRELRRMVSSVEKKSKLKFSDDLKEEQQVKNLPVIHCRDCGTTGWSGIYKDDSKINNDLREFYSSFFSNSRFVVFLFPIEDKNFENIIHLEGVIYNLCGNCLCVSTENKKECFSCKSNNVHRVFVPTSTINKNSKVLRVNNCPFCKSRNSLTILGSRAASLTSVLISQLFASNYNDDKKLITFSDSVQDAAHRAGFFSARTYQLNFRSALQHVIQENEIEKNLDDLTIDFQNYWLKKLGDEKKYIAQFLAPNMEWLADFNVLKETNSLPEKSDLKDLVDKRISWEITAEFGFKSKIGRTLEKTGSAVSYIDKNLIDKTIKSSIEKLQNEISFFRELKEIELEKFLTGILTHLRLQGGIEHEIFKISSYIEKNGDTFILNKIPYMQSINTNSRIPRFVTNIGKSVFEKIISQGTSLKTWYENWLSKIFSNIPFIFNQKEEIFKILLEELEKNNILFRHDSRKGNVWGIKSNAVKISLRLKRMHCNVCDDKISIFEEDLNIWENLNCLRFECNGNFQIEEQKNNYYNKLYSTSDIERIVASEHTGLLERDVREKIEKNFINRMYPWHPNLLSATPTIEMGIDIGDLSSVILCSVPPTQSNYLQRIGRAGRKDGNAFNATVATGKSHDLYFYSDPKEMLEGNTSAPGIFLNASAILERQFTAFCLDDWVKTGIKESEIPYLIKNVLFNVKNNKINTFPYNFFNFIESNKEKLFNHFLHLFKNEITLESIEQIKSFFNEGIRNEGGLIFKINQGLMDLNKEKESYISKRLFIQKKIKEKYNTNVKDQNYEKELEELYREKIGLTGLIKKIEEKETLNYFTDEGLLPNYSFPEAGVILKSVIFRKRKNVKFTKDENEDNKYYDQWTYEYERAAATAINEFAPSNTFYAEGRKVKIDQIDLNTTEIETWQFCDKCSYNINTEKILSKHNSCPRCNSNMWADSAQKKNMIKIRQVFASTNDKDSRIGDDSDDRQPMFYNTQMLVDIDNINIKDAYKIKDDKYPFGFEFVSKANFRNINFGEKTDQKEKEITISGKKSSRKGFMICKDCGKLQKDDDEATHTILCKTKDKENNFVECLYLYREFTSEAIRILLPIATIAGSEKKLSSLIASLQLGLKKKFGGAVDHLKVTTYEEYNEKDISNRH